MLTPPVERSVFSAYFKPLQSLSEAENDAVTWWISEDGSKMHYSSHSVAAVAPSIMRKEAMPLVHALFKRIHEETGVQFSGSVLFTVYIRPIPGSKKREYVSTSARLLGLGTSVQFVEA